MNADRDHDHQACIARVLEQAGAAVAEDGARFTPVRRRALEILLESHTAIGAYELLKRLDVAALALGEALLDVEEQGTQGACGGAAVHSDGHAVHRVMNVSAQLCADAKGVGKRKVLKKKRSMAKGGKGSAAKGGGAARSRATAKQRSKG